jgi:hypothetical protein
LRSLTSAQVKRAYRSAIDTFLLAAITAAWRVFDAAPLNADLAVDAAIAPSTALSHAQLTSKDGAHNALADDVSDVLTHSDHIKVK